MTQSGYTCKVKSHGQRQLELDLTYPLHEKREANRYELELYIFSPYQLNINGETYGVSRFLQDTKSYTRHTIPLIPLKNLTDSGCVTSPLTRIRNTLSEIGASGKINEKQILYELRVLANIYHAQVHETREMLKTGLLNASVKANLNNSIKVFLADIDMFLQEFRKLQREFLDPRVSDLLRENLSWTDEAISLSTEKTFFKLHDLCEQAEVSDEIKTALRLKLGSEPEYRRSKGYPTIVIPGKHTENENFLYRAGTLKKWAESCMFMNKAPARVAAHFTQAFMGIAAGLAMIVALTATFFATRLFAMYSIPWALLIVISYIAKDRIKEILRSIFINFLPKLVADHMEDMIDPATNSKVGSSRARVRFCRSDDIPESVQQLRNIGARPFRRIIPGDNVIHFHKSVRINTKKLTKRHERLDSLTEILRFNTNPWLANMDDPINKLYSFVNGKVGRIPARRVYHINLIVCLTDRRKNHPATLFRYRLVLTRKGIIRIEQCETLSS